MSQKVFAPGTWFRFPLQLMGHLTLQEVAMMGELYSRERCKGADKRDGWFALPVDRLEQRLRFNRTTQTRILSRLIEIDFIQVEKRGFPGLRWVRLQHDVINSVIGEDTNELTADKEALSDPQTPAQPGSKSSSDSFDKEALSDPQTPAQPSKRLACDHHTDSGQSIVSTAVDIVSIHQSTLNRVDCSILRDKNKKQRMSEQAQTGVVGGFFSDPSKKEETSDPSRRLANLLYDKLAASRRIMRPPNLRNWAIAFRGMMSSTGVSETDVAGIIAWYCEHLDDAYAPQAYSANTFVDKYFQIQAFRRRTESATIGKGADSDPFAEVLRKIRAEAVR